MENPVILTPDMYVVVHPVYTGSLQTLRKFHCVGVTQLLGWVETGERWDHMCGGINVRTVCME